MNIREVMFDVMLIFSCAIMTLGIIGIVRMPDIYTKLHGASKAVFLGVVMLCISSSVIATPAMNKRLALIAVLAVLTTPLAAHIIGKAAFVMHERMETPGAVDESHILIDEPDGLPARGEDPIWRL